MNLREKITKNLIMERASRNKNNYHVQKDSINQFLFRIHHSFKIKSQMIHPLISSGQASSNLNLLFLHYEPSNFI